MNINATLAKRDPALEEGLHAYDTEQAWMGTELETRRNEWLLEWSKDEILEIENAVGAVETRGLDLLDIAKDDFPLELASERISALKQDVLHGRGFVLIRGLPVDRWSDRQSAIAFWGIGLHLGEPCPQNGKNHVIGHVKNLGLDYSDPQTRGYQTNARLHYHTDLSDIVGLLSLRASKSGGLSSIASSTAIWNVLAARRPDLARVLMAPYCQTRWGEIPEGKQPWAEAPIFMPSGKRMVARYVRSSIQKGQDLPGVPKMTDQQVEAMDLLDEITAEEGIALEMELRPGDIQLLCNYNVFHSRTAYEDWPEPERRRHLLRLWLACDDGPVLPESLIENYEGLTEGGRPNGILVPGVPLSAPLDAE
ncbi:TauD/TfdA family dioxygenase [Minwuia sp.]|uniref:TauD/TfdA family dioxygenase n=1 Tax=Minwuia sp. TaxID=2493630 RepID=UPI003A95201E